MLCLPDQADNRRIGTLLGTAQRRQIERLSCIGGAAHDFRANALPDRQGFPRQRRLIEDGYAVRDLSVDGNGVSAADQQTISGLDGFDRDFLEFAIAMPHRQPWRTGQQQRHVAPRAPLGEAFEILAAGIHQRHDCGREVLPEQQRRAHRQGGDNVEAEPAAAQALPYLENKCGQDRDGSCRPDRAGPDAETEKMQCESGCKAGDGDADKDGSQGEARGHSVPVSVAAATMTSRDVNSRPQPGCANRALLACAPTSPPGRG